MLENGPGPRIGLFVRPIVLEPNRHVTHPGHQCPALRQRPHPLGHLVEYLQTDIWVRFQKLRGRRCIYICADDTHGTAIMIRARKEGVSEEELIARMQQAHLADFAASRSSSTTTAARTARRTGPSARRSGRPCGATGLVSEKEVEQLYDPVAGTFLADRFVKGTCPNPQCKAPDQYGDSCVEVRFALRRRRPDRPEEHALRGDARDPQGQAPLREHRAAARLPRRVGRRQRGLAAGDRQLPQGPFPQRAAPRLGRLAAGPLFRLRDSRQPGQLLVRLVRRPDRLHRLDASSGAIGKARSSTTGGGAARPRSTTSSARTSPISIRSSGPPCSRRPASTCRRRSTSTAS